ncbi:MAG TPA: hypothetical protein VFA52_02885 [Candidatus Paceibacterota bacterium]|nr:hypothetical protein [Candidatus Paceibacterota bacterium]
MQRDAKHLFRTSVVVLLFIIILSYAFFQARKILEGPEIIINNPKNGQTVTDSFLSIDGVAKNINAISLDDRPIFIDEAGNFHEKLLLYPGYNIMKFEARDKFGKDKIVMLEVNYRAPAAELVPTSASTTLPTSSSSATTTVATSSKI